MCESQLGCPSRIACKVSNSCGVAEGNLNSKGIGKGKMTVLSNKGPDRILITVCVCQCGGGMA